MTNVYTRKYHKPKTTTLLDFQYLDVSYKPQLRTLSPTRCGNPHPVGLNLQSIPCASTYLIWHPDFSRKKKDYPEMVNHLRNVNFTCSHPKTLYSMKKKGQVPTINYTENTISRESYVNPTRFPELASNVATTRFGYSPSKKAVTGIVPNLIVQQYLPVIDK